MLKIFKKRRSIRQYQDKKVEKEKIEEILRAAMSAPSAHNRRSWRFWLVRDKVKKKKLSRIHRWSSFAANAPVILVIGSEKDERWVENCSVVASFVYLEATNQGLGTCWVQVRKTRSLDKKDGEEEAKKILGCPKEIRLLCLMPLGYLLKAPRQHSGKIEKEKVSVV